MTGTSDTRGNSTLRRLAGTFLVVSVAAAILVLTHLYLRVLALDLRAVLDSTRMMNYEWPILHDEWIGTAEWVLRWGAWPLVLTVLVGLGLRVRRRLVSDGWTLGHLGRLWKAAIATLSIVPFLLFAAPFSVALGVWVLVEVVPWVQWYDNLEKLTDPVLGTVVPVLFGAVLLAAAGLVRAALGGPFPTKPESTGSRAFRWVFGLAVVVPVALVSAVPLLGVAVHGARVMPVLGKDAALQRRCSGCHDASAPMYYYKTPNEWRHFLDSTCFHYIQASSMELPVDDREQVLDYITGTRSFSDGWIFATRCRRCHVASHLAWDDRDPGDWDAIVGRLARYSPLYYGPEAREQVVAHLSERHGKPPDDTDAGRVRRRTVSACTTCHFFDREADSWKDASPERVRDMVRRMADRLEPPLDDVEIPGIAEFWQGAIRDKELLKSLVPHDRPGNAGGPPW